MATQSLSQGLTQGILGRTRCIFRLTGVGAHGWLRALCWRGISDGILQMDDLAVLSGRQGEFHIVKGRLAEKGVTSCENPNGSRGRPSQGGIHLVVGVHVLKSLDGINTRWDGMQRDDCLACSCGDIGGRNRLGIVVGITGRVIQAQPEHAPGRQDILHADGQVRAGRGRPGRSRVKPRKRKIQSLDQFIVVYIFFLQNSPRLLHLRGDEGHLPRQASPKDGRLAMPQAGRKVGESSLRHLLFSSLAC